jgi:hypothetical protein
LLKFSEHVSAAIKREFIEEAMNSSPDGAKHIEELFKTADSVNPIFILSKIIYLNRFVLNRFIEVILMIQEIRVYIEIENQI